MRIGKSCERTVWLLLALALTLSGTTRAQVALRNIEPPPGDEPTDLAQRDGAYYHWLSLSEGVAIYRDQALTSEIFKLPYLHEAYELWHGDTAVLLAAGTTSGAKITPTTVIGYARQSEFIVSQENLYEVLLSANGVRRKALVVHKWAADSLDTSAAALRDLPGTSGKKLGEVRLFDILYVYDVRDSSGARLHGEKLADCRDCWYFVGNQAGIQVGVPDVAKAHFLGWLPQSQVYQWNHREAVEYNKDPDEVAWRREKKIPIRFYLTEEDVLAGKAAIEEDLSIGAWAYYTPRYPIVKEKGIIDIGGRPYMKVGVIGDTVSASGRVTSAELEASIRQVLEEMDEQASRLDVVFVIDATGSMQQYFESIRDSVARIRESIEQNRASPIRYAVMYYRDYSEGSDKDSFIEHFEDFVDSRTFAGAFPHVSSSGGQDNPPPFYAIDSAVQSVKWRQGSMRVVILIGDMGNEVPDRRDMTIDKVVATLEGAQCFEFFAVQTAGDAAHPKVALFNSQVEEIAKRLGQWETNTKVFTGNGSDLSHAIVKSVGQGDARSRELQGVLRALKDGSMTLDQAIHAAVRQGIAVGSSSAGGDDSRMIRLGDGSHGSIIKKHLIARLKEQGVDFEHFQEKRITRFDIAYAPVSIDGHKLFKTRVLLTRAELQYITAHLSKVLEWGLNQPRAAEMWRQYVNQISGERDQEISFDENRPLSAYLTIALGIPIRSKFLDLSVYELMRMSQEDLAKLREELTRVRDGLNHYDNNRSADGRRTEKHWFAAHERKFGWVPVELLP